MFVSQKLRAVRLYTFSMLLSFLYAVVNAKTFAGENKHMQARSFQVWLWRRTDSQR